MQSELTLHLKSFTPSPPLALAVCAELSVAVTKGTSTSTQTQFEKFWCSWSMDTTQFLCTMKFQDPSQSQGFLFPTQTPPFNTKQLSWPGAVCKVKLFLALGLTSWRTPWGKDPRSVLFPYSDQHWHITLPDRGRKAATWQKTPGGENISREEFHKQRVW